MRHSGGGRRALPRTILGFAYAALAIALFVAAVVVAAGAARQAWLAMRMRPAAALRG
jgi:hypothetical protein